jgi:hypothetical protein
VHLSRPLWVLLIALGGGRFCSTIRSAQRRDFLPAVIVAVLFYAFVEARRNHSWVRIGVAMPVLVLRAGLGCVGHDRGWSFCWPSTARSFRTTNFAVIVSGIKAAAPGADQRVVGDLKSDPRLGRSLSAMRTSSHCPTAALWMTPQINSPNNYGSLFTRQQV